MLGAIHLGQGQKLTSSYDHCHTGIGIHHPPSCNEEGAATGLQYPAPGLSHNKEKVRTDTTF